MALEALARTQGHASASNRTPSGHCTGTVLHWFRSNRPGRCSGVQSSRADTSSTAQEEFAINRRAALSLVAAAPLLLASKADAVQGLTAGRIPGKQPLLPATRDPLQMKLELQPDKIKKGLTKNSLHQANWCMLVPRRCLC